MKVDGIKLIKITSIKKKVWNNTLGNMQKYFKYLYVQKSIRDDDYFCKEAFIVKSSLKKPIEAFKRAVELMPSGIEEIISDDGVKLLMLDW